MEEKPRNFGHGAFGSSFVSAKETNAVEGYISKEDLMGSNLFFMELMLQKWSTLGRLLLVICIKRLPVNP
jgi:hypothetical protein